jgi:allantoate deiminase
VATVGQLHVLPGATNVVPGRVNFTIDIRSPRDHDRLAAVADVKRRIEELCLRRGLKVTIRQTHEGKTAACSPWLMGQIGKAIEAEGLPVRALPSGAGHDGMAMVDLTGIGMLFVRCKGGISHNPLEAITLEDAEISARVFLRFIEDFRPEKHSA